MIKDFKNNSEIVSNEQSLIGLESDIKVSMVICVWNTSHLLKRSVETYLQQDFPYRSEEHTS